MSGEKLTSIVSKHINKDAIEVELPRLHSFMKGVESEYNLPSMGIEYIPVNFLNLDDMEHAAGKIVRYSNERYPTSKKELKKYIKLFSKYYESNFYEYTEKAKIYLNDYIDWEEGAYGDGGSCYWGSNALAKDNIIAHGGFAVRIHDNADGKLGRCWGVVQNDSILLWNVYWRGSYRCLTDVAFALGKALEIKYGKTIKLINDGSGGGQVYINMQRGIALTNDNQYDDDRTYDLNWKEIIRPECSACGYYVPTDQEVTVTEDGYTYCENCAENNIVVCSGTQSLLNKNNCYRIDKDYYQEGYFFDNFERCLLSEELLPINELIKIQNGIYVNKKLEDKLIKYNKKYYLSESTVTRKKKAKYNPHTYANSMVLKSSLNSMDQFAHSDRVGVIPLSWRQQRNRIVELL